MEKCVVFRADATLHLGTGHVSRCLALAGRLAGEGWDCVFATARESLATVPALAASPYRVVESGAWGKTADLAVIDHYGLDATFERSCRAWAARILVIDDLADRSHDCDLLLDQTLGRTAADYAGRVPAACRLLLGPDFALLRPDFARLRADSLARRDGRVRRVLVSMGGSDPRDVTSVALRAMRNCGVPCTVDVVLGACSPNRDAVEAMVEAFGREARLHLDTSRMADLMCEADLAIGACGVTSWERCALGLPTLAVVTADNQRMIARELAAHGAIAFAGDWTQLSEAGLASNLRRLAADPVFLMRISAAAAAICDGLGLDRIASVVIPS